MVSFVRAARAAAISGSGSDQRHPVHSDAPKRDPAAEGLGIEARRIAQHLRKSREVAGMARSTRRWIRVVQIIGSARNHTVRDGHQITRPGQHCLQRSAAASRAGE